MRTILLALMVLAVGGTVEAGHRRPVRHVLSHVPVVRNVVKCDCGDKCNCLNCCCDSRRLVPVVVGAAASAVTLPVRVLSCVGGCCGK